MDTAAIYMYKGRMIYLYFSGWYEVNFHKFDTIEGAKAYIDDELINE